LHIAKFPNYLGTATAKNKFLTISTKLIMSQKIVIKIGGSNLKSTSDYQRLAQVVNAYNAPVLLVVSAYFGLTNKLINILDVATHDIARVEQFTRNLLGHNRQLVEENIPAGDFQDSTFRELEVRIKHLHKLLISIHHIGEVPAFLNDKVLSYGERLSSLLTSRILTSHGINSEEILPEDLGLITDGIHGFATCDFELSTESVRKKLSGEKTYIVPGFYGISQQNKVTLFGRGGSDYTAAAIAKCLDAKYLDVWKDVDGFLSADPGIVENPSKIERLSYNEAAELAYFGARILHPETISPLKSAYIPLRILNIEDFSGTINPSTIVNGSSDIHPDIIKSITYSDDFGILQLNGAGVGAKPGILAEVTQRLESEKVNIKSVITSQISINILLSKSDLERAYQSILETPLQKISQVQTETDISVIAVVGKGLTEQAGIMYKILGAVASKNINIHTVVMGASKVSAYLIVHRSDRDATIKTIHQSFFENNKQANNKVYETSTF
jgi:aspartate kinase/aspartokinase/homoserine dehydrogenase 1